MRRVAVAGFVLLAIAAGSLLWSRKQDRAVRASPDADATDTHSTDTNRVVPASPGPAEVTGDSEDEEVFLETVEVRGTVVVVDHDGRHLAGESGTLQVNRAEFEVTRGAWRAEMVVGEVIGFDEILLGGRRAFQDPERIEVPPDGVVEVRCRWFVPARLCVIGEKGEDLEGVELAARKSDEIVPVDDAKILEAGPSPVTIPAERRGVAMYWVRARGHAWMRVSLWQGEGGERVVRLVRAGALEARLVPFDPESQVALHVWRAGEYVLGWSPDESGLCRIDGLPPGRLELRAALGWAWNERVIATADIEVEPGKTAEVSLSLRGAPTTPETVRVEGTLRLDPGWPQPEGGFGGFLLGITVDGATGHDVEMNEDGRWSVALVPGRHSFSVPGFAWTQVIDVGPKGTDAARIVVPSPCDVEVHLVDAATGAAVPDEDDIYWHVTSAHTDEYAFPMRLPCAEPGIWRLRVPVGILVVELWNDLHEAEMEVQLKPGTNRIDLKAAQNFACDLALMDGAIPVPVDVDACAAMRVTALGGDGEFDSCSSDFPSRAWFTKPGRYRLSLPAIEGYEPVEPFEVEVAAGRIPRVEVPLKRR